MVPMDQLDRLDRTDLLVLENRLLPEVHLRQ